MDQQRIARYWHIFVGEEQFDYRDELNSYSEDPLHNVANWVKDTYAARGDLRERWREIERRG